MTEKLIEKRGGDWRRLEELVGRVESLRGVAGLTRRELRELGRLYRRAASDLAVARVESRDGQIVNYLNYLLIRAHGIIYQTKSKGLREAGEFYRWEFPAIFRQTSRYTIAILLIFVALALFSFVATMENDDFADFSYLGPELVQQIKVRQPWWETLNAEAPKGAAAIILNNTRIGLLTFAMSIFPIIGTMKVMMPTALMFGSINSLILKYGMVGQLWGFMIGHLVLEFTAIFISGGAGLMLGMAMIVPGERTRSEALIERGLLAVKMMAGCLPIFLIAGLIEAFISPLPIHPAFKILTSLVSILLLVAYLASGRGFGEGSGLTSKVKGNSFSLAGVERVENDS
jgi:uncharacterized membrane protein SpoIIM required for sporulation